jgi:hypothetical protein
MSKVIEIQKPYMVDIRFLQPVIEAYKYGVFENKNLPIRVVNALDSLSWYGDVKRVEYRTVLPTRKRRSTK